MRKLLCVLMVAGLLLGIMPLALAEDTADYSDKEPVTITFGGWGDYFLLVEQCKAFMEKYPWITVDVVKPIGIDWYASDLAKLAATDEMPDVFNIENLQVALQNEWVMDITELFENDPLKDTYPEWMLDYCKADGKLYTLISALYVNFIQVNTTLLDELNIAAPDYDWTIDEWMDILRQTTVAGMSIGTDSLTGYLRNLPAQFGNPDLGWYSYNEETKLYEFGDEFIETINILKELFDERVSLTDTLDIDVGLATGDSTEEESAAIATARNDYMQLNYGTTSDFWYKGLLGLNMNASWALNWETYFAGTYSGFEWDIYPYPVYNEGDTARTSLLNEFLSISSTCEHPEEAYLLLKFMAHDLDGYEAKVDFMSTYNKEDYIAMYPDVDPTSFATTLYIYLIPPSTDERALELFARINPNMNKEGLLQIFDLMNDNGYLNIVRTVPGFAAVQTMVSNAITAEIFTGSKTASDIAQELEDIANAELIKLRETYGLN